MEFTEQQAEPKKAKVVGEDEEVYEDDGGQAKHMDDDEENSEDGDSDCSSEPPEIGLDQNGRIYPGPEGPVNYGFRAFKNCIKGFDTGEESVHAALMVDCQKVFTARQAQDEEAYSAGETYFIRANEQPRTGLERLALDIFAFHAKNLTFDPNNSGAEWWTLVLDNENDVGMHWDKDYALEEYCVNVFPNISTVTYLSDIGGPTMVLKKTAAPRPFEDLSGYAESLAFCSRPKPGKHISFDGRFLHFASTDILPAFGNASCEAESTSAKTQGARVTFLVNIWFNHIPKDAERLPEDVMKSLTLKWGDGQESNELMRLWRGEPSADAPRVLECKDASKVARHEYDMTVDASAESEESETYVVTVNVPLSPSEQESNPSDSILIHYSPELTPFIAKKKV